jgi:dTDP-4-amino-4,6-dideoxygalactose transaminase
VLALPIFPEITESQQNRVVESILSFVRTQLRVTAA